jgi:ClpP class serine protease
MGNYAASGGYYVASNCHRIFANPSTVTGSIGAFFLKFDFSDIASRYGVNVQHVETGSHSAMMSEFQPMTKDASEILSRHIAQGYHWFKAAVSIGRKKSLEDVEKIAQGRIWTGMQAFENGLVDEIGGLDRAIRYAQRNFTISGDADIEVWPKKLPMQNFTAPLELPTNMLELRAFISQQFVPKEDGQPPLDLLSPGGQEWLLKAALHRNKSHLLSGTMLTIDENDALRLMLQEASF